MFAQSYFLCKESNTSSLTYVVLHLSDTFRSLVGLVNSPLANDALKQIVYLKSPLFHQNVMAHNQILMLPLNLLQHP